MKSVISPGVWLLPWLAVLGSRLVAASNSSVTVVSAYWKITSKHSDEEYTRWIRQGVAMSCPMVFFYQHEGMRHRVEAARPAGTHSTVFVHRDLLQAAEKFNYDKTWTHPIHVNNYLLGVVWLDKVFMVADAAASNPFNSEWFVWNDAGNAYYRNRRIPQQPWPNPAQLARLPKDKIIYTDSEAHPDHSVAGTTFMYHISMVTKVRDMFMDAYQSCVLRKRNTPAEQFHCGIDQRHFTAMKDQHPQMFHLMGVGYGTLVPILYGN